MSYLFYRGRALSRQPARAAKGQRERLSGLFWYSGPEFDTFRIRAWAVI
jgi:hypothetical protein